MREKNDAAVNREIGARIRAAREAAGYTQERFAELIDVSPQFESALERGKYGVSLVKLRRICEVLSVSCDTILLGRAQPGDISGVLLRLQALRPEQLAVAERLLAVFIEGLAV